MRPMGSKLTESADSQSPKRLHGPRQFGPTPPTRTILQPRYPVPPVPLIPPPYRPRVTADSQSPTTPGCERDHPSPRHQPAHRRKKKLIALGNIWYARCCSFHCCDPGFGIGCDFGLCESAEYFTAFKPGQQFWRATYHPATAAVAAAASTTPTYCARCNCRVSRLKWSRLLRTPSMISFTAHGMARGTIRFTPPRNAASAINHRYGRANRRKR